MIFRQTEESADILTVCPLYGQCINGLNSMKLPATHVKNAGIPRFLRIPENKKNGLIMTSAPSE